MGIESNIQWLLHATEQGSLAKWIRRVVIATSLIVLALAWMFIRFNGFSLPEAMDQAQIARQLASGQGYTTLYVRPLALHLSLVRTGQTPSPLPETSQPPLGPVINAPVLWLTGSTYRMAPGAFIFAPERAIAAVGFLFFAGALALTYLLIRQLFDQTLALLATGLVVVSDLCWRFAFSGLPQMPMLFFFSGAMLVLVHAMEARSDGRTRRATAALVLAAFLLGLTTLGDAAGAGIFAGFWLFVLVVMRPRPAVALALPAVFAAPLLPWLAHNWLALRNPFGLGYYELARPAGIDRLTWLSDFEPLIQFRWAEIVANVGAQTLKLAHGWVESLGGNLVAIAFFLAVALHTFRRWQPAQFRWAVLFMWAGATAGMCVLGPKTGVAAGQLQILFTPIMTAYGLAFLLMLWGRLKLKQPLLRLAFIGLLYLGVGLPLVLGMMSQPKRLNWPPYLPPLVDRFRDWVEPGEAMASDIPWATAWYARRTSLLLPASIEQFEIISTERFLGGPLVALYLTPFSTNEPAFAGIINGRYREWARFVLREVKQEDLGNWMLKAAVNLPIDGESIFFADRPRWR